MTFVSFVGCGPSISISWLLHSQENSRGWWVSGRQA